MQQHCDAKCCFLWFLKQGIDCSLYLWGVGVRIIFIFVFYVLWYMLNFYKEHELLSLKRHFYFEKKIDKKNLIWFT